MPSCSTAIHTTRTGLHPAQTSPNSGNSACGIGASGDTEQYGSSNTVVVKARPFVLLNGHADGTLQVLAATRTHLTVRNRMRFWMNDRGSDYATCRLPS